jgi:hypothetical protein
MRPADLRRDKVEGTDYFTSTGALRVYAMNRVCQSGPGLDGDPGGGESDRRNAAAFEGIAKQDEDCAGPKNEEVDSLDDFSTEAENGTENLTLPKTEVETTQLKTPSKEVHSPGDEKAAQQYETANGSEAVIVGNTNYYFYFIVTIHPETISDHFIRLSTRKRMEMITFRDIRECILEQLELDFESFRAQVRPIGGNVEQLDIHSPNQDRIEGSLGDGCRIAQFSALIATSASSVHPDSSSLWPP